MTRQRVPYDIDRFFVFLNSKDDLTAVIHGLSTVEALMDDALEQRLAAEGLKGNELIAAPMVQKAAVLTALGMFDAEAHALLIELSRVRNDFAHRLRDTLTKPDGVKVWDALPSPAKTRSYPRFSRDSDPKRLVRWGIVLLTVRLQNRAINGHDASVPYC